MSIETNLNLKKRFEKVRSDTERICAPLEIEDYGMQPTSDVSPPKWHLGHTTWFFEEFILSKVKGYKPFHSAFSFVFNSYYDTVGSRVLRSQRGDLSRPTVRQVMSYRKYVTEQCLELLSNPIDQELLDIFEIGINHEEQHQELLVYDIKYILGAQPLFPIYADMFSTQREVNTGFSQLEAGLYPIGADHLYFCYDNEMGKHKVYLQDFEIANKLVTNAEYLEFIADGGYSDFNLWLSEGLDFIRKEDIHAPLYWHLVDGEWHHYTLNGLVKINWDLPVQHVSYYEAQAFATWKGMRLPTEFEWEVASEKYNWGQLWEWTNSAYLPYPNFQKAAGALGEYNGKFMCNQIVLKGSSVATPIGHSRNTYRNFFHPSSRWLFSGIRLSK
ncbi:ergothioneine biosynthesis protein EgtB [Belliella sp. DSM 111904]|uniref:Ergothioneine biosynthesis protein EgtB n=1 Tax=Belliella filtrata TaxID=2923435 RepID=A0ABS9V2F3_9BACT|nr:ergothioneine biosynthesis protein EgtB [Belliella filtrata]MCH7410602.1 ergothioneine biosynthesis protein EgtB [Belliella filtrata]